MSRLKPDSDADAELKILWLFHSGSGRGGGFLLYLPILRALRARGHEIVAAAPPGPSHPLLAEAAVEVRTAEDGYFPLDFRLAEMHDAFLGQERNAARLSEIFEREAFDLVVSNSGAIRYASFDHGVPHLQFLQETFRPSWWGRYLERRFPPSAYAGPSRCLLTEETTLPFFSLPRIRPPREEVEETSVRATFGIPSEAFVFGMVGSISRHKRHLDLFRRFDALPDRTDDGRPVLLAWIGPLDDTPFERVLSSARARYPDTDRRLFQTGTIDSPARRTALLDWILVASRSEGLPVTVLETLDGGKPAVGFRVGAMEEIVEDGRTGLLAPEGDFEALIRSMKRIISDRGLRAEIEAETARRRAPREHWCDPEEAGARYEAALQAAANLHPSRAIRFRFGNGPTFRLPDGARRILLLQSARESVVRRAARFIQETWPNAKTTLLRHRATNFENLPRTDDILYPGSGAYETAGLKRLVREAGPFDVVVVPTNSPSARGYERIFRAVPASAAGLAISPLGVWVPLSGRFSRLLARQAALARSAIRLIAKD